MARPEPLAGAVHTVEAVVEGGDLPTPPVGTSPEGGFEGKDLVVIVALRVAQIVEAHTADAKIPGGRGGREVL